jgi:hypothetical protein
MGGMVRGMAVADAMQEGEYQAFAVVVVVRGRRVPRHRDHFWMPTGLVTGAVPG